jgi:hypothetical protein
MAGLKASYGVTERDASKKVVSALGTRNNRGGDQKEGPRMPIYLVVAAICLVGGSVMIVADQFGIGTEWRIKGTDLSVGWLLILLGIFNIARWYSGQARRARMLADEDEAERRRERRRSRTSREYQPPDPNFQFTDEPPPSAPPRDSPPSPN